MDKHLHRFHIPVMGTAFTIDSPLKIAKFGISSVVSIGDDELCEEMRHYYSEQYNRPYSAIKRFSDDYRAKRITAYLDLLHELVSEQFDDLKSQTFCEGNDIDHYFEMLPENSSMKQKYSMMLESRGDNQLQLQSELRAGMRMGDIDVNIMTKLDRNNYGKNGELLPDEFSDALSAFRGFANSCLSSGIVFSAGFNRRLFAYIPQFSDFFPDANGWIKKKIIVKVSDFRSSLTQGKFLAKKGIWVSEYRIESGLNCGGHAFATDGYLMGPILEEFKSKKADMCEQLAGLCNSALEKVGRVPFKTQPYAAVTVQGGIGTAIENESLLDEYNVDRTGWATPFLLVPEATSIDDETRQLLVRATQKDLYLSGVSPLGVPFNTVKGTPSEIQKRERFLEGKPGSPCPKGFLVSNMEFTKKPVCTASKLYQRRKIEQIQALDVSDEVKTQKVEAVVEKVCLCEDLAAGALIEGQIDNKRSLKSAVCPGPNLAYFSRIFSLSEMVGHIYGRFNALNTTPRSHMFINELKMYVQHFTKELQSSIHTADEKRIKYLESFWKNLVDGIEYYKGYFPQLAKETQKYREKMISELHAIRQELEQIAELNRDLLPLVVASA